MVTIFKGCTSIFVASLLARFAVGNANGGALTKDQYTDSASGSTLVELVDRVFDSLVGLSIEGKTAGHRAQRL